MAKRSTIWLCVGALIAGSAAAMAQGTHANNPTSGAPTGGTGLHNGGTGPLGGMSGTNSMSRGMSGNSGSGSGHMGGSNAMSGTGASDRSNMR